VRAEAEARLGFCTPILKGFLTELGCDCASLGVQVLGGHGYIKEWGMEQILRDSRIATLYEGTTGIQALDLIGRKVLMDRFFQLKLFAGEMLNFSAQFLPWKRHPLTRKMWRQAWQVAKLAIKWRYLGLRIGFRAKRNPDNAGASSVDFLMFSGYAYMAFMWAKMSLVAHRQLHDGEGDKEFLQAKLHTAEFFFTRMLPAADAHANKLLAPVTSLMAMPESSF
jgi:hypothetical protein